LPRILASAARDPERERGDRSPAPERDRGVPNRSGLDGRGSLHAISVGVQRRKIRWFSGHPFCAFAIGSFAPI
jgi:hypothetical protein